MAKTLTEDFQIKNEEDYRSVQATLSRRDRPPAVLRFLMRVLESFRGARKIGWSRPWNKYGVVNFQSFRLNTKQDADLLEQAGDILTRECPSMPEPAARFVQELLANREQLMGFLFVQEFTENGRQFEGVNLSLGRRTAGQPRYRDRLDLILESPVQDGVSQGFSRLRIYVDPYTGNKEPLWSTILEHRVSDTTLALFQQLASLSWEWADNPERRWDHWTSAYIDYFGPRQWSMRKSYFHTPNRSGDRISEIDSERKAA